MRPQPFVDLLKQWLTAAEHPGITAVHTCAEIGRWEHPVGARITCNDGWALLLSFVRTSPPGGDTDQPERFSGPWEERADYRQARAAADAAAAKVAKGSSTKPQAGTNALLGVIVDVVKRADHAGISDVEVSARDGRLPTVRVACTDGSMLFGQAVGWFAPGAVRFGHDAHKIPEGWY